MPAALSLCFKIFLLVTLLAPLCGCSGDDSEDLTPPSLTLDALDPSTLTSSRPISGTVALNATVSVSVGTDASVAVPNNDGYWETTVDLKPGTNSVLVFAQDEFNTRSLRFDLVYNIVEIDQIYTVTDLADPIVSGRLQTGGSIKAIRLNGDLVVFADPYPLIDNSWSYELTPLVDGTNTLEIDATGSLGETQTITRTITRSADAVQLTVDYPPTPALGGDGDDLVFSGTVEAGAEVKVTLDTVTYNAAVAVTDWSVQIDNLPEGPSVLTVTASATGLTNAVGQVQVLVETDPSVESVFPDPTDLTPVPLNTTIYAVFDQAVVGSTVNTDSFLLFDKAMQPVTGTVNYDANAKKAIFTPDALLTPSIEYTAELTNTIVDPLENPITGTFWKFTTVE